MVLIKEGIVWGQWQAGPSVLPIIQRILDQSTFQSLNSTLNDLRSWDSEEPVSCRDLNLF